jgi:FG-GAP-like repeat
MTQPHLGLRIGATLLVAAFPVALAQPQESEVGGLAPVHRMLPLDRTLTTALVLADVDLDGDIDLVTGNRRWVSWPSPMDGREMLYLNDGTGRFTHERDGLPKTQTNTRALASGDVDGDGDPDLVVANEEPSELWLNNGSGRFEAVPFAPGNSWNWTFDAALGDVDLDGDQDLLLAREDGAELWLNDGAGAFSESNAQVPDQSYTTSVGLCDVDADGDLDALALNGQVRLWLNDGTGMFTAAPSQVPPSYVSEQCDGAFADVDGDGDSDLLLAGLDGWAGLWLNDGQGSFIDASATLPDAQPWTLSALSIGTGDLDGDGSPDFVLGGNGMVIAYFNDGSGSFHAVPLQNGLTDVLAVALGDLDSDGDDDLIAGMSTQWEGIDVQERMWLGQHGSMPVEVTGPSMPEVDVVRALVAADVESDGDQDVFVGLSPTWSPGPLALLENDGSGGFVAKGLWPKHTLEQVFGIAEGDVDGDGDPDVVAGGSQTCRLFLNNGLGDFEESFGTLPDLPLGPTYALAMGDVDGDGDLDLIIARQRNCRLWLNDGAGRFTDARDQLPDLHLSVGTLQLCDLDADGDPDVLLAGGVSAVNQPPPQGSLWLNDGHGRFSDESAGLPVGWSPWFDVASGDVDRDGDLDLVVKSATLGVLLNDGHAHFTASPIGSSPALMASGGKCYPALLDADGDHDLDLVVAGVIDSTLALFENDGSGHFALAQESRPDVLGITLTWSKLLPVELDGDGDLDLVVGSWGSLRTVSNLSRQITWRSIPRVGEPLTFDLYGSPNVPWTMYVATEGVLAQRDAFAAAPWRFVAQGTLDANGRGEWTFNVPASPTLAGATWVWRSTIGQKPSNFERTTFLGP